MKITEITVTDERGETHTLRCSKGIDLDFGEAGEIVAVTAPGVSKNLVLSIAAGRWISYRLTRE